ncbi:MAG TPA: hypothetical protein VGK45_15015 [Thermoanaerobaculia bacterium]|jgi:hypothetical protein
MTRTSRLIAAAALLLSAAPVFAAGPLRFFPLTPCRLIDTRSTDSPALVGNATRNFTVQGKCGIPVNAKAVAVNATIVGPNSDGYITLFPSGTAWPGTANLTFKANEPALGNGAIVPLSASLPDLSILLFQASNTQHANVVVDGTGYFCSVDVNGACIP